MIETHRRCAERSLVLRFHAHSGITDLANALDGQPEAPHRLAEVANLMQHDVRIEPLFERPDRHPCAAGRNWRLQAPQLPDALADAHILVAPTRALRLEAERLLSQNDELAVHPPAEFFFVDPPATPLNGVLGPQKSLELCGFTDKLLAELEIDPGAAPIATIDSGVEPEHVELVDRFDFSNLVNGEASNASHASEVAAIISARRGDNDESGMAGCCNARVHIHNAWTQSGYDPAAFYRALESIVRDPRIRVLNLSVYAKNHDAVLCELVDRGLRRGLIIVASVGNDGKGGPKLYPASHPSVIAVGAVDDFGNWYERSTTGDHIWLSAPGKKVRTVVGTNAYRSVSGTSFAAPLVAAAAWLVTQHEPLGPTAMRDLLGASAKRKHGDTGRDDKVGWGYIHLPTLRDKLKEEGLLEAPPQFAAPA